MERIKTKFVPRVNEYQPIAWHYTTGIKFQQIVESGFLLPTSVYIEPGESPILWFSLNQDFEPTAVKAKKMADGKIVRCSKEETSHLGKGLVRFGYPSNRLTPWSLLWKKANMQRKTSRLLEATGYKQGAIPSQWMGCLDAIPINALKIEVWDKGDWKCVQNFPGLNSDRNQ